MRLSKLYAHKRVFDRVMEGVADRAGNIRVGHGLDPQTQFGPLVSDEQFKRVTGYLDAGRQQGAKIVTGGSRVSDHGYFVQPTVLTDTKPDMSVVREEIFGPVVLRNPVRRRSRPDRPHRERHHLRPRREHMDA